MKKLLDVNLWLALTLPEHPQHTRARTWFQQTPLLPGELLFCRPTELGLLRLSTQERIMQAYGLQALTNETAIRFLARVCADPVVALADEPPDTRSLWLKMAGNPRASPNLWTDAYLAALAVTLGAEMVTFDQGFKSYVSHGLRLVLLRS